MNDWQNLSCVTDPRKERMLRKKEIASERRCHRPIISSVKSSGLSSLSASLRWLTSFASFRWPQGQSDATANSIHGRQQRPREERTAGTCPFTSQIQAHRGKTTQQKGDTGQGSDGSLKKRNTLKKFLRIILLSSL